MTKRELARLRKIVHTATRGKGIKVVATRQPPCILALGFEDYEHAKAVAKFIETFDAVGVGALLDEIETRRTLLDPKRS